MGEELLDSAGDLKAPRAMDAMRGTNFIAGRRWLRDHDLELRYLSALPAAARSAIELMDAADWAPMEVVIVHYAALDSLETTYEERLALGGWVSGHINGVVLSTVARLAGSVGLSPFVPLSRAAKLFARNFRHGAAAAYKVGPTEARFEVHGCPMASSVSHRDHLLGALLHGAKPFAADVHVSELSARRTATSYALRLKW